MRLLSRLLVGGLMALSLMTPAQTVLAQPDLGVNDVEVAKTTGLATGDIRVTVARIIRAAMGLLGILAVCIVLYGGFLWMTAGGNDEKVGEAKKWLISGVIGLAIILMSFAIASFVVNSLVSATVTSDADANFLR